MRTQPARANNGNRRTSWAKCQLSLINECKSPAPFRSSAWNAELSRLRRMGWRISARQISKKGLRSWSDMRNERLVRNRDCGCRGSWSSLTAHSTVVGIVDGSAR